jgi:hypothetical protein
MHESPSRVEEFKADVAAMRLRDPASSRDRLMVRVGAAGLAAGIVVAVVAYSMSHGTTNPLQQRDALVIAVIGLAITVAGAALFVRGSLAGFLRFWLARLCYEQAAQTDRVVAAVTGQEIGSAAEKG